MGGGHEVVKKEKLVEETKNRETLNVMFRNQYNQINTNGFSDTDTQMGDTLCKMKKSVS